MTSEQLVLDELFAQRVAVQAQPFGRAGLVVVGLLHHDFQQRPFDHTHQHVVHAIGRLAAQVAKVALQALAHAFFYVFLAHAANPSCSSCSASKPVTAGSRSICCPRACRWSSSRRRTSATSGGARCSPVARKWPISRKIHGRPCAARPIMIASAPVAASTSRAFSGEVMSPLATTGTFTAALTAAMVSYSAWPL